MTVRYEFALKSLTPLLLHADDVEKADELEAWRKDPRNKSKSKAGDDRSPPWTWLTYLYFTEDGKHLSIPAENLTKTLSIAGASVKMVKNTTFKKAVMSTIFPEEDQFILHAAGKPLSAKEFMTISEMEDFKDQADAVRKIPGCRLFLKRAVIGQSKHVRVRLRLDDWSIRGHLAMQNDSISADVLKELFTLAGRFSGLCDWRPSSKSSPGRFGMFTLAELKKLKE